MKHLLTFNNFLREDFSGNASSLQNTPGMGNVQPGETSAIPIRKRKKKKK